METLSGKTCLITGASRGIGKAIARKLAGEGCTLFLTAQNEKMLTESIRELQTELPKATIQGKAGDLTRQDQLEQIAEAALAAYTSIDILINNAGIFPIASLKESTNELFSKCFDTNVRAPFLLSKALAPQMIKNTWGRIVNIGSSSAYDGFADTALYCSSKHALLGLSRSLHAELKEHNVRVYCVSPRSVQTDMGKTVRGQDFETFIDPADIAEYVAFLISFNGNLVSEEIRLNRMFIR